MSDIPDDEREARRLQEPFAGRGAQPFEPSEQYPRHYEELERTEAPVINSKADAVEEILLKMSGGEADYGIQPRDGGFAFVKTVAPADDRLDYYGVPAQEPLAWAPTLDAIQDKIILLDSAASAAVRTGAAEWSEETIRNNPWTAVYLPTPDLETADITLLRKGLTAARECADSADNELAGGLAEARAGLLAETIYGRTQYAGVAGEMPDRIDPPANQNEREPVTAATEAPRHEFSFESIARDPWSAVNDAIPKAPSDELLLLARTAVADCIDQSFPAGPLAQGMGPPVAGADRDFNAAMDRDEALFDIAHARALAREPMTVEAIEADPWNAITRDLPADGPRELYEAVFDAAAKLRDAPLEVLENAPWPYGPASDGEWADLGDAIKSRMKDAGEKLHEIDLQEAQAQPEIVTEAVQTQQTTVETRAPGAPEEARTASEAVGLELFEPPTAAKNFLSGWFIARAVTERLSRAVDIVLGTIIGYFVDDPKMTEQQIHETLQARGNIETIRAQEVAAAAQEDRVAYEYSALAAKSAQQEKDVYLSLMLGTPPTAEANLGRDEYEHQREEQRSQDQSEGERYRGRHL